MYEIICFVYFFSQSFVIDVLHVTENSRQFMNVVNEKSSKTCQSFKKTLNYDFGRLYLLRTTIDNQNIMNEKKELKK